MPQVIGALLAGLIGPALLVVIITTIVTPVLLKMAYKKGGSHPIPVTEGFSNAYEELGDYRWGAVMYKGREEIK